MSSIPARRMMAGTGWKMNNDARATARYGAAIRTGLAAADADGLDLFVLPPFTSLAAARGAFAGTPVSIGAQNVHWDEHGAWTGEISAPMLAEAGCRYVALAHSERLAHFNESYDAARRKLNAALAHGITPILCLGETAADRDNGLADRVLAEQVSTALADRQGETAEVVLAYEPRWAIGAAAAASPGHVAERHGQLREMLRRRYGGAAAARPRSLYGGSVTAANAPALAALADVDGLFVGRAAWTAEGLIRIAAIVARESRARAGRTAAG